MSIYRMSSWTHRQPGMSASFKAPRGEHAVMIAIGNIPKDSRLTKAMLLGMLAQTGLALTDDCRITDDKTAEEIC